MFLSIYFPRVIHSSNAKFKAKLNLMQSINKPWRLSPLKTTETKTLQRLQRPRHLKKNAVYSDIAGEIFIMEFNTYLRIEKKKM